MANKVKFKPHKGLLKRVRVSPNGKVKHRKPGTRHRKSMHKGSQSRRLRRTGVASERETMIVQGLLRFKIRNKPESCTDCTCADKAGAESGAPVAAAAPEKKPSGKKAKTSA